MNKQWIWLSSDRPSISKLSAKFSHSQLCQETPVLSINMPWYFYPLFSSADVAKSSKEEAAIAHEILM